MNTFVSVRSAADLAPACRQISGFFVFRRQEEPTLLPEPVLGIWNDPCMIEEVPSDLIVRRPSINNQPGKIQETFGLSGVWKLCWLENDVACRLTLMEALIEASHGGDRKSVSGRFMPVFYADASDAELQGQVRALADLYPHHGLEPIKQDPETGELFLPIHMEREGEK